MADVSCSTADDCRSLQICLENVCASKDLFPLAPQEIFGTLLVAFINSIGTSVGIGGGEFLTPYFILIFQRTLKESINYAFIVVFGGALGTFVNTGFLRDPVKGRPVINYDINLVIIPMLMVGVLIGAIPHLILPDLGTYFILLAVLAFSFIKTKATYSKRLEIEKEFEIDEKIKAEDEAKQKEAVENKLVREDSERELSESERDSLLNRSRDTFEEDQKELNLKKEEEPLFPWKKFRELALLLIVMISINLMRGGKDNPSIIGIPYCSSWYWGILVLGIICLLLLCVRNVNLVKGWQTQQIREGEHFRKQEIIVTKKKAAFIGGLAVLAGIIGATIGIGGALILSPILLGYGMPPKYTSFTTGFFIIFTMFGATIGLITYGLLDFGEVAWFGAVGFMASYASSVVVTNFLKSTGKQSMVLSLILYLVGFSSLIIIGLMIYQAKNSWDVMIMFHDLC